MIQLNGVVLRACEERDLAFIVTTRNQLDVEMASQPSEPVPSNVATYRDRLDSGMHAVSSGTARDIEFIVAQADDPGLDAVGIAGLYSIDRFNGLAEFGVTITATEVRGKGVGFDTHLALLRYGFDVLRLNRIFAQVKADNGAAIRTCERIAMTHEGTLREHRWKNGAFVDLLVYGLLCSEWQPDLVDWRSAEAAR